MLPHADFGRAAVQTGSGCEPLRIALPSEKEVMFMDTRLVRDPAEVEQLLSEGYELDSIVFWADNPERSYMLVKR